MPFDLNAGSGCGVVIRSKVDEKFVDSGLIVNRTCKIRHWGKVRYSAESHTIRIPASIG